MSVKTLRNISFGLLGLITLALAAATVFEKTGGTAGAFRYFYHSPWMITLWALAAVSASAYIIVRRRSLNRAAALLHFALLVILTGAAISFATSVRGIIILYEGIPDSVFVTDNGELRRLPFTLQLVESRIILHPGTDAPADYASTLLVTDGGDSAQRVVSMNNVLSIKGYRFYQTDIGQGVSVLTVARDVSGIAVTYTGYALLVIAMLLFLLTPGSRWRALLRKIAGAKSTRTGTDAGRYHRRRQRVAVTLAAVCLVALTLHIGIRWAAGGHVPLTNGHEAMLAMAWIALALGLTLHRPMPALTPLSLLVAALAILAAATVDNGRTVEPLAPVLNSRWLAVHVSLVILAYALFAIMAVNSLIVLCGRDPRRRSRLAGLSALLLYPAVFALAAGIFTGAVWANQSWGRYWGWDPKETWALITLLIYALPLHARSFPLLSRPRPLHAYLLAAFLSVLITYFGVNYLLPGLHSYAD